MEFQERAIHRPDLVFLDEMMLELDEIDEENNLIEQENWEGRLVKVKFSSFFQIFEVISKHPYSKSI